MFGPDLGFLDPYEYEIYNKADQHSHHSEAHNHPLVQAFNPIAFVLDFLQQNTFFVYLTSAMALGSVLFNAWVLGLFVFEYDKSTLTLDQTKREELPPQGDGGPQNRD